MSTRAATIERSEPSYRVDLMEELYRRYATRTEGAGRIVRSIRLWRKRLGWLIAVGGAKLIKRLIDLSVSFVMLVGLSPLLLVVALLIKLTDGGPVLFPQRRVGRWGREFWFYKFRSMRVDAEELKAALLDQSHHEERITFKMKRDPRVTWIGRILRKTSIDETPQLWCVLKGDMSLVGPRPPVPEEVAKYTLTDRRRLDLVPGLTCIWQVSGRGDIPFSRQVELDLEYVKSQSILLDLGILVKTIPAVLSGKGSY